MLASTVRTHKTFILDEDFFSLLPVFSEELHLGFPVGPTADGPSDQPGWRPIMQEVQGRVLVVRERGIQVRRVPSSCVQAAAWFWKPVSELF